MGPRWPSHHSESAGTCSRCARDPPPGLQRAGGLSDPRAGGPLLLPQTSPAPALLVAPPLQAIPSVSQAPVPSAGQVLVSVLLLPNCRPCGSGSGARHVKRKRCSWRAPPWVTFTGNQGVQGVLRRTSGQASGLHVLNSCRVGGFRALRPANFPAPGYQAQLPRRSPSRSPGRSCHSRRSDGATARHLHSCCYTCSRSPRKPRRWAPGKVCFHYRTWGGRRSVTLGRGTAISRVSSPGWRMPHPRLSAATASSPLLPALAHADAAPVAGRWVTATSLTDLEADPTGRAALCPR